MNAWIDGFIIDRELTALSCRVEMDKVKEWMNEWIDEFIFDWRSNCTQLPSRDGQGQGINEWMNEWID